MTIKQIVSEFFAIGIHLDALLKVRVKGGERFQYLRICSAKMETRSEMSGIIVQLLVEFTFSLGGICTYRDVSARYRPISKSTIIFEKHSFEQGRCPCATHW